MNWDGLPRGRCNTQFDALESNYLMLDAAPDLR